MRLFPDSGRYPFSVADLVAVSVFSAAGAALIWRLERARALRMVLLVYGLACIGVYLVPSALGSNITRLQLFAIPIVVLVASLRSWRPLPICLIAVALAVSWNVKPLVRSFRQGVNNDAAAATFWAPAIDYFHRHLSPSYRVEAVGHGRTLAGGVLAGRRHSAGTRLVQTGRLSVEHDPIPDSSRRNGTSPGCTGSGCGTCCSPTSSPTTAPDERRGYFGVAAQDFASSTGLGT